MSDVVGRLNNAMDWVMEFDWPMSPKTQSDCMQEFLNSGRMAADEITKLRGDIQILKLQLAAKRTTA